MQKDFQLFFITQVNEKVSICGFRVEYLILIYSNYSQDNIEFVRTFHIENKQKC